ncbi:hypothetical protein VNO80_03298 [Phaseolus coccineus]|uniref:Uncharacterized protein n=1 Tax=Phaseolus coccineus TaxID=3886 RepID=A0AAN9NR76_PHACN
MVAVEKGAFSTGKVVPSGLQRRILKDLYYNNRIRSPSAEQIQRISVRLRHYEPQSSRKAKERFTSDNMPMQKVPPTNVASPWNLIKILFISSILTFLLKRMSKVALWCVQYSPNDRPLIITVVKMLEGKIQISPPPFPFQNLVVVKPNLTKKGSSTADSEAIEPWETTSNSKYGSKIKHNTFEIEELT